MTELCRPVIVRTTNAVDRRDIRNNRNVQNENTVIVPVNEASAVSPTKFDIRETQDSWKEQTENVVVVLVSEALP